MTSHRTFSILAWGASALTAALLLAEAQPAPDAKGALDLSAALANVTGAPDSVRIEILRWSTDEERELLMSAWSLKSPTNGPGRGAGKGAAKAGKAAVAGKRAAKGVAPEAGAAAVLVPEAELGRSLQEATTVGYLWSSELTGYALRYAGRVSSSDGSQRIVLITQRRLGGVSQKWAPTYGAANNHEFSVIELRLNAKGEGEGKASLTGKVVADAAVKIVALEDYDSLPVVFRDVRPETKQP